VLGFLVRPAAWDGRARFAPIRMPVQRRLGNRVQTRDAPVRITRRQRVIYGIALLAGARCGGAGGRAGCADAGKRDD